MFQKKQLHDICNLDHHTKLPCYDFCKICVNYKQAPATVRIVEENVAWILFIKQILWKPCFLPPCTTDNANKCCKNECIILWFWHGSELANLLRKFSVTWCGATAGECRSLNYVKAAWGSWGRLRSCRVWLSRIPRSSVWWCVTVHCCTLG